jgi:hypothetical protein
MQSLLTHPPLHLRPSALYPILLPPPHQSPNPIQTRRTPNSQHPPIPLLIDAQQQTSQIGGILPRRSNDTCGQRFDGFEPCGVQGDFNTVRSLEFDARSGQSA